MKLENYGQWSCEECPTGQHQSPVNVVDVQLGEGGTITLDYHPLPLTATDTGRSIQFNDETARNSVTYQGNTYVLKQFHFHLPSEHHINGDPYSMELHLVHWNDDTGFLVVAVMIDTGEIAHPGYATLAAHLPNVAPDEPETLNPLRLLPEDHQGHYSYHGSLTTPPCTENVQWVILTELVMLTQAQLDAFGAYYLGNNRPLQPINERIIHQYT